MSIPELRFDPGPQHVTILTGGLIDFTELYSAIRKWEASVVGIVYDHILRGVGEVELPDGSKTPRVMIFVNGWRFGQP